jgi:hypothetical protein
VGKSRSCLGAQARRDFGELLQRSFEIIRDLIGDHVRWRHRVCVCQVLVLDPEEIEAEFVAFKQVLVFVAAPPAFGIVLASYGLALVHAARLVAFHEFVEIAALDRLLFQGEVLVRAQVVDPESVGPRLGAAFLLVEEDHVRLHAGGVPDAGRQAQQSVDAAFLKEIAPYFLARAAFKEDVVGHDHRHPPLDLEQEIRTPTKDAKQYGCPENTKNTSREHERTYRHMDIH